MKQIVFFGNIGAGKTTRGEALRAIYSNVQFIEEDVTENPFLSSFYKDMKKWGFHSSIAMLGLMSSYYKQIDKTKEIIIIDQGIEELIAYTWLEKDMNILTNDEYDTYKKLYDNICNLLPEVSLYVYFKCDLIEELRRIKQRGREFELSIDYEFLHNLQIKYEQYVSTLPKDKLLIIDTTNGYSFDNLVAEIENKLDIKFKM